MQLCELGRPPRSTTSGECLVWNPHGHRHHAAHNLARSSSSESGHNGASSVSALARLSIAVIISGEVGVGVRDGGRTDAVAMHRWAIHPMQRALGRGSRRDSTTGQR